MSFSETAVCAAAVHSSERLGYRNLKELQMQVIVEFVMGQDVFAILPTGYGKSFYDKLHEDSNRSIVVVVTPLTAIMEDQASWN